MSRTLWLLCGAVAASLMVGCAGSGEKKAKKEPNPWADVQMPGKSDEYRVKALERAWAQTPDREAKTRAAQDLFWAESTGRAVRLGILRTMADDPEATHDLRRMLRLSLPHERDPMVMIEGCAIALARGWTDMTTPLVRALSVAKRDVPDMDRIEARTLAQLNPGKRLVEIALDVVAHPGGEDADLPELQPLELRRRAQVAAWTLAARLDPIGEFRRGWVMKPENAKVFDGALAAALTDLGQLPETGEEATWITRLHEVRAKDAAWWNQVASALATLPDDKRIGVGLRHLEPVRWAHAHRPEWIEASKGVLLAEVATRQSQRRIHVREIDQIQDSGRNRERASDWEDRLSWADLVAILVVDEALAREAVQSKLFQFARLDRDDTSTEYGGAIVSEGDGFAARLYPPRPSERLGDEQFVASEDLFEQAATALAIFHFHVQKDRRNEVSGPSRGDLVFAARSGRTSIVISSIDKGIFNADVYQPDGAVIDLGELHSPESSRQGSR